MHIASIAYDNKAWTIFQGLSRSDADWANWNRTIALVNCKLCSFAGVSSLGWFGGNVREGYHYLNNDRSFSILIKKFAPMLLL